jgi:hypothetical protein
VVLVDKAAMPTPAIAVAMRRMILPTPLAFLVA